MNPKDNPWRAALVSGCKNYVILERLANGNINVTATGVSIGTIYKAVAIFKEEGQEAQYFGMGPEGSIITVVPQQYRGNATAQTSQT